MYSFSRETPNSFLPPPYHHHFELPFSFNFRGKERKGFGNWERRIGGRRRIFIFGVIIMMRKEEENKEEKERRDKENNRRSVWGKRVSGKFVGLTWKAARPSL